MMKGFFHYEVKWWCCRAVSKVTNAVTKDERGNAAAAAFASLLRWNEEAGTAINEKDADYY